MSYGGHQAWYPDRPARQAGCGSVAAANQLAVLAFGDKVVSERLCLIPEPNGSYTQSAFLSYMEGIYRRMGCGIRITKPVGITISRYVRSVIRYGIDRGLWFEPHILLTPYRSYEEAKEFLDKALDDGQAVTLALSWNEVPILFDDDRKPQLRPVKNHYLTISGMEKGTGEDTALTISSWGRKGILQLKDLVRSWQSPKAVDTALIYFTADGSKVSSARAYRRARWLVLKTLLRIPFH